VDEALEEAGVSMGELAGVVVGQGPGSFTGVRVAAATAKGLAHALRIPLWPVSSLAAAAVGPGWDEDGAKAGDEDDPESAGAVRYVLFDARGERIYAACYRVGPSSVAALVPPRTGTLGQILTPPPPAGAVFAGTGARRHRERIVAAGFTVAPAPCGDPGAVGLLRWLGLDRGSAPADDPGLWEPTYLRPGSARPTPGP
jgi:tRNA threonylcarbamoyladenosine biosynthesis protein TsaB